MDYMLSNILSAKNKTDPFYKFEIRITEADKTALYNDQKTRQKKVQDMAASMIYQNALDVHRLLVELL